MRNNKIFTFISRINGSPLFKRGVIYAITNQLSNIIAWLNFLLVTRFLPTVDVGNIIFLQSIQNIFTLPSSAISTTFSSFGAKLIGAKDEKQFQNIDKHLTQVSKNIGIIVSLMMMTLLILGKKYFNLNIENKYLVVFSIISFIIYSQSAQRGRLYARLRIDLSAFTYLLEPLTKLLIFVFLLYFGVFSQNQVILGLSVSFIMIWTITKYIPSASPSYSSSLKVSDTNIINVFIINAFVSKIGLMMLNNIDLMMVKHYLNPMLAGIYAQILMTGNILFFGAQAAFGLLLPVISHRHGEGKSAHKEFFSLTAIVGGVAMGILILYLVIPFEISRLLLGNEKGANVAPYIFTYGIGMVFLSIAVCFNSFSISKNDFWPSRLYLLGTGILSILLSFFHNDIWTVVVVTSSVLTGISLMIISYQLVQMSHLKSSKIQQKSMIMLLKSSFVDIIFRLLLNQSSNKFQIPKIAGYEIEKVISSDKESRLSVILTDRNQVKYFARIWIGNRIDQKYHLLKNEIIAHNYLLKCKKIFKDVGRVDFAQIVQTITNPNSLIFITNYLENVKALRYHPKKFQSKKLRVIMDYFDSIKITRSVLDNTLVKNSLLEMAFTFPFFVLKAIFKRPYYLKIFFKAFVVFYFNMLTSRKKGEIGLVYTDLSLENIVISKNKLYLIDLDEIYLSYKAMTGISFIVIEFSQQNLCREVWEFLTKSNSIKFLKTLMIFRAIKGLNHFHEKEDVFNLNDYNALEFALSNKKNL